MDTRTVHDPFLGKDVQVSNKLVDRLRGRYAMGPMMTDGEPEFGWREFKTPPVQHEAAVEIERLQSDWRVQQQRASTLAAENDRLRSALIQIEDVSFESDDALGTCIKIAQRALSGSTGAK